MDVIFQSGKIEENDFTSGDGHQNGQSQITKGKPKLLNTFFLKEKVLSY